VLLAKYRLGEFNLELLQAFTLTDDHAAQEAVWEQLQPWDRKPQSVRRMLSEEDIPATDKRVRFVGLDAYEAEGGAVRRDLFAEGEEGVYVSDHATLARLVGAKLESIAQGLSADGWKWVAIHPEIDYQALAKFKRIAPTPVPLPNSTLNKLRNLEQKRAKLQAQLDESDEDDVGLCARIDELEQTTEAIYEQQTSVYDDNTKATCGLVVSIGSDGEPQSFCGLLRKGDEAGLPHSEDGSDTSTIETAADDNAEESSAYSASLIESLTQTKTAAIAAELSQQPNIALAALVHALVLSEFGLDLHLYGAKSSLQVSSHEANLAGAAGSPALAMLDQKKLEWAKQFPTTPDGLWLWCLDRPQETLLELLACCVARTVHGVQSKTDSNPARLRHADALARALDCDIAKWFTPTAENFFLRVSKAKIAEALTEAGKSPTADISKCKKAQLAALAETEIRGTNWLPGPAWVCGSND
jgi:ParB family chromosome partitioning protein